MKDKFPGRRGGTKGLNAAKTKRAHRLLQQLKEERKAKQGLDQPSLRAKYPALKDAWDQYQMILTMVRTEEENKRGSR